MSQPGKVDLSMFEGPPPAAPRYRSAQPAVQQNPFAPAQPAAQPNPFTQPAAAADPFSPPPAPAPADPFSPPPAAPDPFSPPPNGFRGASAAPIADNPFAPAAPAAPVDNPFFGGPSDDAAGGSDSLLGALDPDAAQPEESLTVGEIEAPRLPEITRDYPRLPESRSQWARLRRACRLPALSVVSPPTLFSVSPSLARRRLAPTRRRSSPPLSSPREGAHRTTRWKRSSGLG